MFCDTQGNETQESSTEGQSRSQEPGATSCSGNKLQWMLDRDARWAPKFVASCASQTMCCTHTISNCAARHLVDARERCHMPVGLA